VNQLAFTLSENQQSRSQWVTDIAHELRTPIAVLLADVESVQDGVRQANADWLKSMRWQADRIGKLVNDLNELSVSDAGALQYHFAKHPMDALVAECLAQYQHQLEQAQIELTIEQEGEGFTCRADAQRIEQLFANLMQNTIRYTDAPAKLQVSVNSLRDIVVIKWSDSGPGVSDSDLVRLFDRLYRVDASRNRETGGSGLGLAIVKNIVDAHQGEIHAEHSVLGGVSIVIKLPKLVQG
jgi:two-component system sensor histidine kinase BaeS